MDLRASLDDAQGESCTLETSLQSAASHLLSCLNAAAVAGRQDVTCSVQAAENHQAKVER